MRARYQAHRFEDEWEAVTFWEVLRTVLLALVLIAALWGFYLLAWSVWGS